MSETYEGVLPVHKPSGWTSHDVVAKVRRLLRERRIGHTGTLDPAVTGVLPLCVGRATRLAEILQELPKTYEAEMTIGYATDTEDASGAMIARAERVKIEPERLIETFNRFVGRIEQIPPMYSAVKKDGKRLYELAREGIEVERKPRSVTIYEIALLDLSENGEWPTVRFRVRCSKGTYIRTLCVDIGKALGYPAVMSKLVRTETGGIPIDACYDLDEIATMVEEGTLHQAFIPIDRAVSHLPDISIDDESAGKALNGQSVALPPEKAGIALYGNTSDVRVYDGNGLFIGIFSLDESRRLLIPNKVFPPVNTTSSGR